MCGSGFSVEDDRGISAIVTKKRFIFYLRLKLFDCGGPLVLPTSSL